MSEFLTLPSGSRGGMTIRGTPALLRDIAAHHEAWAEAGHSILAAWTLMLRDPRPHGGRAYLAWVRRHAPKRRRFRAETRGER